MPPAMSYQILVEQLDGTPVTNVAFATGELVIGRSPDCGIVLPSHDVSRRHARLFLHLGRLYVEDLGSANGVVVDGAPISGIVQRGAGPIVIGSFVLHVVADGSPLPPAAPGSVTASEPMLPQQLTNRSAPKLTVVIPGEDPLSMALSGERIIIGRSQEATVQLAHASVSRQHAQLVRHGADWVIEDLGSANGTRVNGQAVTEPVLLSAGDQVEFGDVDAVFGAQDDRHAGVASRARRSRRLAGVAAVVGGIAVVALAGALVWTLVSDDAATRQRTEAATTTDELARELQAAIDEQAWADAQVVAQRLLTTNPSDERAKQARTRADLEIAAEQELTTCAPSADRAAQADSLGDMDSALARTLESIRCLERVPASTSAGRDAAERVENDVGPRLIGLQRRAAGIAMDRQQPEVAVQHLNAAHQRVTTALSADLAAVEPAIRRELFAARWAAGVRAAGRDAWQDAATHFRHAAALGSLDDAQQRALAEADARARR